MKWREMSVFHKVVFILTCLSLLAMFVVLLCCCTGLLPGLYDNPLFLALFGATGLGEAILHWKKNRVLAIFNLVTASLIVGVLCWWLVVKW